jgi:hypothetical protein
MKRPYGNSATRSREPYLPWQTDEADDQVYHQMSDQQSKAAAEAARAYLKIPGKQAKPPR